MSRKPRFVPASVATSIVLAGFLALSSAHAQGYASNAQPGYAPQGGGAPAAPQEQAGNPALAQFREVLQRHGSFGQHPRYGEVWMPTQGTTVPQGWSPYPACKWVYDRQLQAWSYQDSSEWGNIVHHYGRWAFDQQAGWMWIADATYGPGWVLWRSEGGRVTWAALTPDVDGGQPTTGWHSQDQQTFNAGCRPASPPPPPLAYRAPAPAYSPPPISYAPAPPSYGYYPPARLHFGHWHRHRHHHHHNCHGRRHCHLHGRHHHHHHHHAHRHHRHHVHGMRHRHFGGGFRHSGFRGGGMHVRHVSRGGFGGGMRFGGGGGRRR